MFPSATFLLLTYCALLTLAAKNNSSNDDSNITKAKSDNDNSSSGSKNNKDKSSINTGKRALIFPEGYNVNLPPEGDRRVWISHVVRDIADVNDKDFSITFILETMIGWNDERVEVNPKLFKELPENSQWYMLRPFEYKKLWQPGFMVEKLKSNDKLNRGSGNGNSQQHQQDGSDVLLVMKEGDFDFFKDYISRVTVSCVMDFKPFPFDRHECYYEVTIGEFFDNNQLEYLLRNDRPTWGFANVTTVLQYNVEFADIPESRKNRSREVFSGHSTNISYAGFTVTLTRISTPFVLNYYLPSGLFVIVSWTSYAIPVKAIPGRISLIMTAFLSLVNIANSAFENSPGNQGINQMQTWIISCIFMVCVTIMEYFVMLTFKKFGTSLVKDPKRHLKIKRALDNTDSVFLRLSPLYFFSFCAIYTIAIMYF